jgi:hypothetical protein
MPFDGLLPPTNANQRPSGNSPFLDGGIRRKLSAVCLTHYFNRVLLIPYGFRAFMDGH